MIYMAIGIVLMAIVFFLAIRQELSEYEKLMRWLDARERWTTYNDWKERYNGDSKG